MASSAKRLQVRGPRVAQRLVLIGKPATPSRTRRSGYERVCCTIGGLPGRGAPAFGKARAGEQQRDGDGESRAGKAVNGLASRRSAPNWLAWRLRLMDSSSGRAARMRAWSASPSCRTAMSGARILATDPVMRSELLRRPPNTGILSLTSPQVCSCVFGCGHSCPLSVSVGFGDLWRGTHILTARGHQDVFARGHPCIGSFCCSCLDRGHGRPSSTSRTGPRSHVRRRSDARAVGS